MIDTKYGELSPTSFDDYKKFLTNRIWMLLPLREEGCLTIDENINRLNRELFGLVKVAPKYSGTIISIINTLENVSTEENFEAYRADILRCCHLLNKVGDRI